jgi:hypothetical protein
VNEHAYPSLFHQARDPERLHECNAYCEPPDIHAAVLYTDEPLDPDDVAIMQRDERIEIIRTAPAPEAPDSPNWKVKTLVWVRANW